MDSTKAAQSVSATAITYGGWTVPQLILIGVIALIVILGIVAGMRRKRRRVHAEHEREARRVAAHPAATAPSPSEPMAEPDEPAQPFPLADVPLVGGDPFEATPATLAAELAAPPPPPPAPPEPTLAPTDAADAAAGEAGAPADDLALIKGIGPKLVTRLAELGITRVTQLAALTPAEAEALDAQLGAFQGRMTRDRWLDQAKLLAAGDKAGFEAEFGKL